MFDSLLHLIPRMMDKSSFIIGWRGDTPVTNDEFVARVSSWRRLSAQLPGQRYALYLEDAIEFAAALFGAWHAGKTIWLAADTLTPTNEALKLAVDGFLGGFPKDCAPICVSAETPTVIPAALGGNPASFFYASANVTRFPPKAAGTTDQRVGISHSNGAINPSNERSGKAIAYQPLDHQFIGLVVHTSGTTGVAQAIPKKMSQLAIEVNTLEKLFGEKCAKAEIISTVTHQHIYGLLFKVLWPLTAGRAIHAHTQLYPEEIAQFISARSCILISSPAHLKRLPEHLDWNGGRLRAAFSSGGLLTSTVALSTAALLGQSPIEIYGSSETGGIAWRQRAVGSDESWSPMLNVEWRISGEEELIEIRSPHLLTEEWLQLADRAQAQSNGRFVLKGRRDRIVKIEEKRISLDLVEQRLAASSLISEVKVVALSDEQEHARRQCLAAVVVLSESGKSVLNREGKLALNRQLKAVLTDYVEPVAVPRKWRYVDQIPVNAHGKTPQSMLGDLFNQEIEKRVLSPNVKLIHRDDNSVEFELIWPLNLLYFQGHFPQAPILPGVAQVDWAIKTARQIFGLPNQFRAMHALKFQQVIVPDRPVHLRLEYDQEKACLNFSYFSTDRQHSSGRVLFESVYSG